MDTIGIPSILENKRYEDVTNLWELFEKEYGSVGGKSNLTQKDTLHSVHAHTWDNPFLYLIGGLVIYFITIILQNV